MRFQVETENAEIWTIYGLKIYGILVLKVNLYLATLFYDSIINTKLVIGTRWYDLIFSDIHTKVSWF